MISCQSNNSIIRQIKAIPIESVYFKYVTGGLRKSGKRLIGICPFKGHEGEKNPSFFLYPDQNSCWCHGCNMGGSVIDFVMNVLGVDTGTAIRTLAADLGITPDNSPEAKRAAEEVKRERYLEKAFEWEYNRVYSDLAACYQAIENNPRHSIGLEHISGILEMVMDELMEKDIARRVEAMRYAKREGLVP